MFENCGRLPEPVVAAQAQTLAEARQRLEDGPVDLVILNTDCPGNVDLAHELRRRRRRTQLLFTSSRPTVDAAVEAVRVGAVDFLPTPLAQDDLVARLRQAMSRRQHDRQQAERIRRLRRACRKLDQARVDVGRQVDILCSDLVTAYQELAAQMQEVASVREYENLVRNELDLEQLLRRTLEYLIEKGGPTNAAIFLPATADEWSLGGYVNYDCTDGAADLLLQHLADVLAPKIAGNEKAVQVTSDTVMSHWLGDDAAYLEGSDMLAFACRHEGEPLAVVAMFRDRSQPFDDGLPETCDAVAEVLGRTLVKVIRVHHRHKPEMDDYGAGDDGFAS